MSYGITSVSNTDGKVVIDADYRNLEIVAEGTLPATSVYQAPIWTFIYYYEMPAAWASDAILFVKMNPVFETATNATVCQVTQRIGNKFIVQGTYKVSAASGSNPNPANLPYFVARASTTVNPTMSGYGAAVMDSSGRTVYRSDKKYVRVNAWGKNVDNTTNVAKLTEGPAWQGVVNENTDYISTSELWSPYQAYCEIYKWPRLRIDIGAKTIYTSSGGFPLRGSYQGETWGGAYYDGGGAYADVRPGYIIAGPPS